MDKEKIIKAGKICKETKEYVKGIVKPNISLLKLAEEIESKIISLGGKPAFPVNLSINEIAAHYTPSHDDKTLASGLLKVDFGVQVDGWSADNSISFDLENSQENKKLIQAAEESLNEAIEKIKREGKKIKIREIGKVIEDKIESHKFSPIVNLSGHSMEQYDLHAGITIPNIDNKNNEELGEGLFAIEPFTTTGNGKVKDGKPSGIYHLLSDKNTRNPTAREVLAFIKKEYNELPFCSRWLVKKFGTRALIALKELEANGNLHHYPQLVEVSGAKVAQAENTILVDKDEVIVTTT